MRPTCRLSFFCAAFLLLISFFAACSAEDSLIVTNAQVGEDAGDDLDTISDPDTEPDSDTDISDSAADPSCDDGKLNGQETDIDCGGPDCDPCGIGSSCESPDDCETDTCEDGVCIDGQCLGVTCDSEHACYNGDCFPTCSDTEECATEARCVSGICLPTDCASMECGPEEICVSGICYPFQQCVDADDCAGDAAECIDGACVDPTCSDGLQNGSETDVDCGGPDCPTCDLGFSCQEDNDCASLACDGTTCVECIDDAHCPLNQACSDNFECFCQDSRTTASICSAENAECGQVTDVCGDPVQCAPCTGGEICSDNTCVECTSNSHCGVDELCTGNQCICPTPTCSGVQCGSVSNSCGSTNHCGDCLGGGVCSGNTCYECILDSHCPSGQVCSGNTCYECISDHNCPGTDRCHDNQCVECTEDSHCPANICGGYGACLHDLGPHPTCGGTQTGTCTTYTCNSNNFCESSTSPHTRACTMPDGTGCVCTGPGGTGFGSCHYGSCCGQTCGLVCPI